MSFPKFQLLLKKIYKYRVFIVILTTLTNDANGQSIDLNRPVGMTEGTAGSSGGAALYTIPIDVPNGVKEMQPQVALSYSSQGGGNGYSGLGWSISPLSMITRSGKNVFHNGIATPVDFTGSNDAFILDGQRLMLISGNNGAAGSVYGTEQESFNKIEAINGTGNSPDWFKVTTKNGTVLEYGSDNMKMATASGAETVIWLLRRATDASGNYVLYSYNINTTSRYFSLSSISYPGNINTGTSPAYQVLFTYSTKSDWSNSPAYISGEALYSANLLDRIDVKKSDGTQIRSYVLSHQYLRKKYFLASITESGANGTALNPISFTYGKNTSGSEVTLMNEHGYNTNQNYSGDFDGDGMTDVQSFSTRYNTGNGETWFRKYQIYDITTQSTGVGKYVYDIQAKIPYQDVKVMGFDPAQNPFAVTDFDGDGKDDVVLAKFNQNSYDLTGLHINYSRVSPGLNPGDKSYDYKEMDYNTLPSSFYGVHKQWKQGGSFFVPGDFDGDGHSDYIMITGISGYSNAYKAFFSSPSKGVFNEEILGFGQGVNGASGDFAANSVAESKAIIPINFDGDSKMELLVVRNEGSYVLRVMPIPASTGYSYGSTVLYTTSSIKTDYRIFPGDFNGDGITDLFVRPSKDNDYVQWQIFMGTGKAFNVTQFAGERYRISLLGDGYSNGHMITVGDYDGDGKSEIWHSIDRTTSSSSHVIYYFNGTAFSSEEYTLGSSINTESAYTTGDFNGDGKPDFMKIRNASSTSYYGRFLLAKPFKEQNLLVAASNLGYQTNFDYGLLNNKDYSGVYSRTKGEYNPSDWSSPTPYIPDYVVPAPATYVVSNIRRPNGLGYQSNEYYTYEDLAIHSSGRGALGFLKTDVRNDMGHVNRTWYNINLAYSMLFPDVTQIHLNYGGLLTRTRYSTTFQSLSTGYQDKRFFMKQDRVFKHNWLTTEGQEVLNTYDNFGNITKTDVKAGPTDDFNITSILETATSTTTYGTYAGAPYPGFPTSIISEKTRSGQAQVSKTTNYTYTANGLPQTVTDNAGTPIATTVTNTYNSFGLPTQTVTTAPGVTTPVVENVYDPTGRFLIEKKLTGSGITKKETSTYDDRWGVPLSSTSTDGLTTTYQYDEYGGLYRTNLPDGNAVTSTRSWEASSGFAQFSVFTQRTDGSSPQKSYLDILGREIKTEKRGFGNQWLTTTKYYNYYGQLSSETAPYYPGEQVNYTYYYYDSYGRPSSTVSVTGSISTSYSTTGGTTYTAQTTNALGQWTSKTSDASGKVISTSENGANMNFTYDSWGNQLTAGSNGQTFITNIYDSYGRVSSQADINAGTIIYERDALGRVVKQTDGNNQIHTTVFDAFGRVATTTGPQGTTTYTYYYDGGTGKSNDNITQVVGFSGDVRSFQYDNLQRLQSETITATGGSMTKTYTYDGRGNLSTTSYPAGFLIRNIYDDNDIIVQKKYEQGATIKTLFTATAINSRGVYTSYSTGNGKAKSVTWDYNKEAATRYYTAGIQDLNLDYESNTMNLLSRRDAIRSIKEEFTYDAFDRLTSAKVNGVQQFAMTYDNGGQGKILQKTDIGNYNYDITKPHALASLSSINPSGADPNTVIGTQVHNITYTAFEKTASINENGYVQTYTYGSDQQRLTSELKLNGSTVETKSYWGDIEGLVKNGNTYEIYYIQAGNGLNNIIVKQNGVISIYYPYTDQLGSIVAVTNEAGTLIAEQNFDAWGRKRNPGDWTYNNIPTVPDWLYRGFTGHEHLAVFNLINMNGRMYDPMTGMMLGPDDYVANPWSPGGYNRFLYANGNPLKFTDPDGEFLWIPVIIGAVIGAYTGGVLANDGEYNPVKWDYQNGKTWGYMIGGALVGGISGGVGGYIATSGIPYANTLSIMASSLVNSVGTNIYTGGQTDITMAFGIASFNFTSGEFDFLGKKGNSLLENIGFALGALANIQDVLAGFRPGEVNLETEKLTNEANGGSKDLIGHSQVTDKNGNLLIDFGPGKPGDASYTKIRPGTNSWEVVSGQGAHAVSTKPDNIFKTPITLKGVNLKRITAISQKLNNNPGGYNFLLRSCSSVASRSLLFSGRYLFGGIHPYLLRISALLSNAGLRPAMLMNTFVHN